MSEKTENGWGKFLFAALEGKNTSHKIAYIAVMVALNVVVNAIGSIPLGFVQFSLTLCIAALTGILIGPLFGFVACFLGDTLGYMIGVGTNGWTPWVGISMGVAAVLAAVIVHGIPLKFKGGLYVKLGLVCFLTLIVCTYAINTTAAYYLWNFKGLGYKEFLIARMSLQIWNNLINGALLFIAVPALNRIKPLKIQIE